MSDTSSTTGTVNSSTLPAALEGREPIAFKGQRVLTTELAARSFGTDEKALSNNFDRNRSRFEEGKHFHKVEGAALRALKDRPSFSGSVGRNARSLILWTERGIARHAKILETEAAWAIFEALEDTYFRVGSPATAPTLTARNHGGITKNVVRAALGDMVPEIVFEALALLLPEMVDRHLEADPRAVAVGYKPALAMLEERGVPSRRRRPFSQKVSARLRRFSLQHGHPVRISRETGRYLFHVDAINAWIATEGDAMIRDHVAAVEGQGVFPFPAPRRRPSAAA